MLEPSLRGLQDRLSHKRPASPDLPAEQAAFCSFQEPSTFRPGQRSHRSSRVGCPHPCLNPVKTSLLQNPTAGPGTPGSGRGPWLHVAWPRSHCPRHFRHAHYSAPRREFPVGVSCPSSGLGLLEGLSHRFVTTVAAVIVPSSPSSSSLGATSSSR